MAGPESSLNTYVSHSEDSEAVLAYFGDENFVRTSGTFSYISGYTAFLSFIAFLAIGYNMTRGWRLKNNMASVLALALVIGAMSRRARGVLSIGHLEKFLSPSRHESDSVTARGHGRRERAGHGAEGLFRC
jgi:hypothetical protein